MHAMSFEKKSWFVFLALGASVACSGSESEPDRMPLGTASAPTADSFGSAAPTLGGSSPVGAQPPAMPLTAGPSGGGAPGSPSSPQPIPPNLPGTVGTTPSAPTVVAPVPSGSGPTSPVPVAPTPTGTSPVAPVGSGGAPSDGGSAGVATNGGSTQSGGAVSGGGEGGVVGEGGGGGEPTPAAGGAAPGPLTGEPELEGTATRPVLSAADAAHFSILSYLASAGDLSQGLVRDDWNPTAGVGDVATFTPTFVVGASGGTHTSVQQAITDAVAAGGEARVFIELLPGTYREVVCVPTGAPPITLYGTAADASSTTIVFDNYADRPKAAGSSANPCNANASATNFGTSGSATFASNAAEFHAKNVTFSNDTDESAASGAVQAVALLSQGDRAVFENVRVLGNQDTLFVKTPNVTTVTRAYFRGCYVEGDVDFIFGRGVLVLDDCTVHTLSSRNSSGVIVAPSTDSRNPYGILIANSTLTAEPGTAANSIHLGRAWDESQGDVETYAMNVATGVYPNGQATYRESTFGPHVRSADPWRAAATTARPYSSTAGDLPANRFYEFDNTGP